METSKKGCSSTTATNPLGYFTDAGFTWGAAKVTCVVSHNGGVLIEVAGKKKAIDIWISPQGQNIKVVHKPESLDYQIKQQK